jgi:hypothetical protein
MAGRSGTERVELGSLSKDLSADVPGDYTDAVTLVVTISAAAFRPGLKRAWADLPGT